jgi:hypothetical protein
MLPSDHNINSGLSIILATLVERLRRTLIVVRRGGLPTEAMVAHVLVGKYA